jgi:hypothetical protein
MCIRDRVREARKGKPANDAQIAELEGSVEERRPWAKESPPALAPWSARLQGAYDELQSTDAPPLDRVVKAAEKTMKESAALVARWKKLSAAH